MAYGDIIEIDERSYIQDSGDGWWRCYRRLVNTWSLMAVICGREAAENVCLHPEARHMREVYDDHAEAVDRDLASVNTMAAQRLANRHGYARDPLARPLNKSQRVR